MTASRREHTSGLIRGAAVAEFTRVGPRTFSLQDVAKRAYVSVGAVYDRWSDRDACIADLVSREFVDFCAEFSRRWNDERNSLAELLTRELQDEDNVMRLRFVAECIFAARDNQDLAPDVRAGVTTLIEAIQTRVPDSEAVPDIGWWAASTLVGYGLLSTSGCSISPTYVSEVVSILERIGACARAAVGAGLVARTDVTIEPLRRATTQRDPRAASLVDATLRIIEDGPIDDADARSIAGSAGVTTGALYRRFAAKADLLAAAFHTTLEGERYAWLDGFVHLAEQGDFDGISSLLADRCTQIWTDQTNAHMLLEFTIAAHSDERIQQVVLAEMTTVAEHRASAFAELASVGVIRGGIEPTDIAWCFQVPTVGMRILGSIGITPTRDNVKTLLAAYLVYLITEPA